MLYNIIMRRVIESVVYKCLQNGGSNENFTPEILKSKKLSNYHIIAIMISLLITQLILLVLGRWLWNTFLVPAVENVKPLDSVWQLLGISILLKLLIN